MEQRLRFKTALLIYNKIVEREELTAEIYPRIEKKDDLYIAGAEDEEYFYILFITEKRFDVSHTYFMFKGALNEVRPIELVDGLDFILKKHKISENKPCPVKLFTTALEYKKKLALYENYPLPSLNSPPATPQYHPGMDMESTPIHNNSSPLTYFPTPDYKPQLNIKPPEDIRAPQEAISKSEEEDNGDADDIHNVCRKNGLFLLKDNFTYRKVHFVIIVKKTVPMHIVMEYISRRNEGICNYYADDFYHYINIKYRIRARKTRSNFKSPSIEWEDMTIACIRGKLGRSFVSRFKPIVAEPNNSLVSEYAGRVLSQSFTPEDLQAFEKILTINVKQSNTEFVNEAACSSIMNIILRGLSKYSLETSHIYAFEKQMTLHGETRRCDGIYRHGSVLTIMEFKSNTTHKQDSVTCAEDRGYLEHVFKYLALYDYGVLNGLTSICEMGIEFYGKNLDFSVKVRKGRSMEVTPQIIEMYKNYEVERATTHLTKSRARTKLKKINVSKKK